MMMNSNRCVLLAVVLCVGLAACSTWAQSVTSQAEAYWTFDSIGAGDTLADASGNGYTADIVRSNTLTGDFQPSVEPGFVDTAFKCGGGSQYGYFSIVDTAPIPNGPFTICTWIKPLGGQWSTRIFYYKTSWSNRAGFDLCLSSTKLYLSRYYNGEDDRLYADLPLQINYWCFVSLVWDGTYWKMYMNGRLVASDNDANLGFVAPTAGTDLVLGGYSVATNNTYTGLMDQTRVWQSALTAQQIEEVMLEDMPD